jgi:site-specific DNA recombinase
METTRRGNTMKAVIYTRVSTDEQAREGVSLANQLAKCRLQAQLDDMEIVAEIEDAGKSAKNLNREGIQKILHMVKHKECDAIVILKLDRFTRNITDLNEIVNLLNKYGVSLVSVQDHLDTLSASGRMVMNLLATISQWERETIAERTSTALQFKKSEMKRYCGVTPYGYMDVDGSLAEVPVEQNALAMMRTMRNEGAPFHVIASKLNELGIKPRKGAQWHFSSVRYILIRTSNQSLAA